MKKIISVLLFALAFAACKEDPDWAKGRLNPTIAIGDVRALYSGGDLVLTSGNMSGAVQISGVVTSDYSAGNIPDGIIVLQQTRRSMTYGIAVYAGDAASEILPGDSLVLRVEGKTLTRENGMLVVRSLDQGDITVASQGRKVAPIPVSAAALLANPDLYESVLVRVSNCEPVETPAPDATYEGDTYVGDGSGVINIHVRSGSTLASRTLLEEPSTYLGLVSYAADGSGGTTATLWPRFGKDIINKYMILAWDLTGYNISQGPTRNSTVNNANLEVSVLSRGPGIEAAQAGNAFSATWPIDADLDAAILRGSYYQFTITPLPGATVSLTSLDIVLRVQPNGPKNYVWLYSLDDGESFGNMSGDLVFSGSTSDNNGIQQPTLDVSEVPGVQEFSGPMIVRLYAWGAANTTSTFRIGQSLTDRPNALSVEGFVLTE